MEVLGERPVWSMSDSEKLSALDAVFAETARLKVIGLQLIADMDESGYATELGAGSTARLLSKRYRIDSAEAHRDVRLATRLTKYAATTAALPDPAVPFANPATAHPAPGNDTTGDSTAGDKAAEEPATSDAANTEDGGDGEGRAWRVSPAQAAAIVSVLDKVPASVPIENLEFAEQRLIDLAATHTPSELRKAGQKIRDILDPDGPEPDEKAAYARESLTWKTAERGVTFRGYLANENAELFRTQIHAYARPQKTIDGELDPRPLSKRQADALTTLLNTAPNTTTAPTTATATDTATSTATRTTTAEPGTQACAESRTSTDTATDTATDNVAGTGTDGEEHGEGGTLIQLPLPPPATEAGSDARGGDAERSTGDREFVPGHGPKPHISITIDYNDLTAAAAAAAVTATGALVFGDNLSAATIRRLACDAEILPIVLGSKSQPLDVGTSQRLVTRPIRRALNARDKGCVVCGAPPIHCEAHHVVSWLDHGITAISNLVLLCKRHHLDLHSGHWHIRILDGVVHVTYPTWSDPDKIPRGRYRPPTADIIHQPATPRSNPWGDDEHPPAPNQAPPPTGLGSPRRVPFDPWGDDKQQPDPNNLPPPTCPGLTEAAPVDPWGDGDASVTTRLTTPASSVGRVPFDPWNDGDADASDPGALQPPTPADRAKPTTVDPWGDADPESQAAEPCPAGPGPTGDRIGTRRPPQPAPINPSSGDGPWSDDGPAGPDPVEDRGGARRPTGPARFDSWADDPPAVGTPA